MSAQAGPSAETPDIASVLAARDSKDQLRFIICGSVDDGKSTLLGRLLHDSGNLLTDQMSSVRSESRLYGSQGDSADLALVVDGLQAEREQGITIDVAYRAFETAKRRFIAIDAPGHEQYTRNMATGASNADAALILVDAENGIVTQTRRHSHIISLLGIRRCILAVNKMDIVDHDLSTFMAIADEYWTIADDLGIIADAIPVSALTGENVFSARGDMPWYTGPTLAELLEGIDVSNDATSASFRMPVQWVNRSRSDFRGYSGTIASGTIEIGATVIASPSGRQSRVKRILGPSGELETAIAGQSVTVVLADEIDISRGEMLASADDPPEVADHFAVHLIWTDQQPMLPERVYSARVAGTFGNARITDLTHRVDIDTQSHLAAKTLELNEIGYCKLTLDRAIPFDPYSVNRHTGGIVLIDKFTNATVGAGVIDFALRRSSNITWQDMKVDKATRSRATAQRPCVLWLTGLSGAGKSTIADRLEQKLQSRGRFTYLLDGDNLRHGLNKDLGFTEQDRVENIRRVAEVSRLMVDAGLIVIVSFISPFRSEREMARSLVDDGEFFEIHVDTPLEVCEDRDPKGLYAKARSGDLVNFTGIDSPYEPPEDPDLRIDTTKMTVEAAADTIIELLNSKRSGRA